MPDPAEAPPHPHGSCLCGAVRYEVTGPLRPVVACHCSQCRKTSGHYVAATAARRADIRVTEDRGLKWYRSSAKAVRGFCGQCGSNLFWAEDGAGQWSIMAGTLEPPTGLRTGLHIFTAEKSDYYALPADEPTQPGGGHSVWVPEA